MRRCSIVVALWIGLVLVYMAGLYGFDLPVEGALLGAVMTGSLVWFGLLMMNAGRSALRDLQARERFQSGLRPRDGEFSAVIGEIRPTFEALRAPLSGRECVAYRCDVGKHYISFAAARCAVHSPFGTYVLESFPSCTGFAQQSGDAQEYVAATRFEELSTVTDIMKYTRDLHSQTPPLRIDWRLGAAPESVRGVEALETVIESGATVTAYGRFVSATNGLVTHPGKDGYLRLEAGTAKGMPPGALAHLLTGLALIVIANVGLAIILGTMGSR